MTATAIATEHPPYLLTVGNLQAQADAWAVVSHTGQMQGRHSLAFLSCVAPPPPSGASGPF